MQVRYRNTPEDLGQVVRCLPWSRRVLWQYGWILQLFACTLPGAIALMLVGDVVWPLIFWSGLLLLLTARWIATRFRRRPDPTAGMPAMTLRLTPDYLESATELGCGRRAWSLVRQVQANAEFVLILLSQQRMFAVPRRAFASAERMQEFALHARQYLAAARQQATSRPDTHRHGPEPPDPLPAEPLPLPPPPPNPNSASPFAGTTPLPGTSPLRDPLASHPTHSADNSPCFHIRYQNSAWQIALVRQHGLAKPEGPVFGGLALAVITVVMTLALFMARGNLWMERAVPDGLFLFLSTFCCLWLWTMVRPLVDMRHVAPELLQPLEVTVAPAGVQIRSSLTSSQESWAAFQLLQENDQFLGLVRHGQQDLFLIPKSAFEQPDEPQRFAVLVRQCLDQAARPPAEDERPLPPRQETGNPYQSPSI